MFAHQPYTLLAEAAPGGLHSMATQGCPVGQVPSHQKKPPAYKVTTEASVPSLHGLRGDRRGTEVSATRPLSSHPFRVSIKTKPDREWSGDITAYHTALSLINSLCLDPKCVLAEFSTDQTES